MNSDLKELVLARLNTMPEHIKLHLDFSNLYCLLLKKLTFTVSVKILRKYRKK